MPDKKAPNFNFNLEQFKYEVANELGLNPGRGAVLAAGVPPVAGQAGLAAGAPPGRAAATANQNAQNRLNPGQTR